MPSRAWASSASHPGLDSPTSMMLCSFMGGVSFGGRLQRPRFGLWSPEGYTAFSSFTHLLRLPPHEPWQSLHPSPGVPCGDRRSGASTSRSDSPPETGRLLRDVPDCPLTCRGNGVPCDVPRGLVARDDGATLARGRDAVAPPGLRCGRTPPAKTFPFSSRGVPP